MQPTLCSKCKKNVAVVFISRMNEKNEMVNEGLCLKCAAQLGLPQVEDMMKRMGITPEDLENINSEMMQAFGGAEELDAPVDEGDEDDEESGKTATFPFLNRLFNNGSNPPAEQQPSQNGGSGQQGTGRKTEKKRKFLDNYCINLSQRAREGKLDAVIGREQEIERVVQILNRRQKNNPCLIGEPGVGKTAIAEGLAQRIAAVGDTVEVSAHDADLFSAIEHSVARDAVAHTAAEKLPFTGESFSGGNAGAEDQCFRLAEVRAVDHAEAVAEGRDRRGTTVKDFRARVERLFFHRFEQRAARDVRTAGVIGNPACAGERDIVDPAGEDRGGLPSRAQRERRGDSRRAASEDHGIIFHMVYSCRLFRHRAERFIALLLSNNSVVISSVDVYNNFHSFSL